MSSSPEIVSQALAEAINKLPEAEKLVMTLAVYEGLTDAEIAATVTESEATVTALHESALQHLAEAAPAPPTTPPELPIDPMYLPFSEQELNVHFAPVKGKKQAEVAT